jgi:transcriptional regulator with XRE-family HTH domain
MRAMNDIRMGSRVRAVRLRLGWRQSDVADRAGVSQSVVCRVEHGQLEHVTLRTLRRVLGALEVDLELVPRWRGGDLDRLADEDHAALVGRTAALLESLGWQVAPEVSFAVYGERGSIDLLAWHPATRTLLVVEVKTAITSVEETLRRHDVKVRLAPAIARERFGWEARSAARLLVLPEASTARRRVARHATVFGRAYPLRGRAARAWLRGPSGAPGTPAPSPTPTPTPGMLVFLSDMPGGTGSHRLGPRRRVRRPVSQPSTPTDAPGASLTRSGAADGARSPGGHR